MANTFRFKTKNGSTSIGCESKSESDAWLWLSKRKNLSIEKLKELFNIEKIEK